MQFNFLGGPEIEEKEPEVARVDVWWDPGFKTWVVTMYDAGGNTCYTDGEEESSYHHRKSDAKSNGARLAKHYDAELRVFTKQGGI